MRKHRAKISVVVLTLILTVFGMIMMYVIGPLRAKQIGIDDDMYFLKGQLKAAAASLAVFALTWLIFSKHPEKIRKFPKTVMLVSLFLCVVLWVGGMAGAPFVTCELGACRWLNLGISFQPAEAVKFGVVLMSAEYFSRMRKEGRYKSGARSVFSEVGANFQRYNAREAAQRSWKLIREPLLDYWIYVALGVLFVVAAQKDMGSAVPVAAIVLASMWIAGVQKRKFAVMLAVIVVAFLGFIVSSPHRMERVATLFGATATSEQSENDYHARNALIAIGSGGLTGVGVGNSVQAAGYLPESVNDSIFAAIGEMFGMIGLVVLLVFYAALLFSILSVGDYSTELEFKLIADGIAAWLFAQIFVNTASMVGLIPLTGVTLPLISYGGSSMLVVSMALGLVTALSQYTGRRILSEDERDREIRGPERAVNTSWRRRV